MILHAVCTSFQTCKSIPAVLTEYTPSTAADLSTFYALPDLPPTQVVKWCLPKPNYSKTWAVTEFSVTRASEKQGGAWQ